MIVTTLFISIYGEVYLIFDSIQFILKILKIFNLRNLNFYLRKRVYLCLNDVGVRSSKLFEINDHLFPKFLTDCNNNMSSSGKNGLFVLNSIGLSFIDVSTKDINSSTFKISSLNGSTTSGANLIPFLNISEIELPFWYITVLSRP